MLFNFTILALYGVGQTRRRSRLGARKSWPAPANNVHKGELQVHQPKTVERWQPFLAIISPYLDFRVLPSFWMSSPTSSNHSMMPEAQCGSVKYSGGLSGVLLHHCCSITVYTVAEHKVEPLFGFERASLWISMKLWFVWKCNLIITVFITETSPNLHLIIMHPTTFWGAKHGWSL